MTLTNHEPLSFQKKRISKVDSILNSNKTLKVSKGEVETYKDIYLLLYTDHSIKIL
jgi:hypothetical protein